MSRPRLCWFCGADAIVAAGLLQPVSVLMLDSTIRRGNQWFDRYLCAEHQASDPWEAP